MRENTSGLDRPVRAEHAEDGGRSRRGRDRPNPERTGRGRLKLGIHAGQARIVAPRLAQCATRGCGDRAVQVGSLRGSDGSAIRLAKSDADSLTVGHADISAKAVEDVVLSTNGVGLVDEVNETTLL